MLKNSGELGKGVVETAVNLRSTAKDVVSKSVNKLGEKAKTVVDKKENWYKVYFKEDDSGMGEESDLIIETAHNKEIETVHFQSSGARLICVHCSKVTVESLVKELGDKYGYGTVNKTQMFQIMNKSEKDSAGDNGFDANKTMNTVIDGAYCGKIISEKKGIVFVGEKEISRVNCETYEIDITSEQAESIKKEFAEYRKHIINPLMRRASEKYIAILWRNGEKSVACVDCSKYDKIIKTLS